MLIDVDRQQIVEIKIILCNPGGIQFVKTCLEFAIVLLISVRKPNYCIHDLKLQQNMEKVMGMKSTVL